MMKDHGFLGGRRVDYNPDGVHHPGPEPGRRLHVKLLSPILVALVACSPTLAAEPTSRLPQRVIYVGKPDSDRARQFVAFLAGHFAQARAVDRDRWDPSTAADV